MENKNNPQDEASQLMEDYVDYLERFNAFQREHIAYIKDLVRQAKEEGWDIKPLDPQDVFNTDALIADIEHANAEDEVEGFHSLKYSADVYHQYQAFKAEGRYFSRKMLELQIDALKGMIEHGEGWLVNAKKAIKTGDYPEGLPDDVAKMAESLKGMKNGLAVLNLELAAMQPHVSN